MDATQTHRLTAKDLKRDHAALYAQLRLSFMAIGAEAERARIKAVLAQALAGDEDLVHQLAFDGVTTGLEAARLSLKSRLNADHRASKRKAASRLANVEASARVEAPDAVTADVSRQASAQADETDAPADQGA